MKEMVNNDLDQDLLASLLLLHAREQMFILDSYGRYLLFNAEHQQAMESCFGTKRIGKIKPGEKIYPDFMSAEFSRAFENALNGEKETLVHEVGMSGKKSIWFESVLFQISGKKGNCIGVGVLSRDVSQRVHLETELRAAKDAAMADAKAKSAFLSSMSHEIRTPMNAILGLTELLLTKNLDENSKENLSAIRFSANNLLTIINDILDLSKIEAGKLSFDLHIFDFQKVMEELNRNIQVSAKAKNLVYEVHTSGNIPNLLKGDSVRLSQILLNLLGNSVKFTQTGKISLSVDILNESPTDLVLEFKIADTGIGIPKDKLASIFQSFTQVHNTRKFQTQGTGLGLSITKKLVELQEGNISVQSEVGKGTVFTFFLPFLKASEKEGTIQSKDLDTPEGKFSDLKVLLVEDNKINQLLAKQILVGWGVNVEIANDGFEAIAKLRRRSFDLVFLDLQMPEMDGFEVAKFVRTSLKPPANEIPIVALTADAFIETRKLTEEAGMNDFITKPYQQKDLFRVLRKFSASTDTSAQNLADPATNEQTQSHSIDFEFVKEKFGKDSDTLLYILEVFKNDIGEEIQSIRQLLAKKDVSAACRLTHKLVSTFSAMGMPETAGILSKMERMLKQGESITTVQENLELVEAHYDQAIRHIDPYLQSIRA